MLVDLFSVQPLMKPEDYLSREAFYHKIDRYFQAASRERTADRPAVIVFPEDLATFLLLEGHADILSSVKTVDEAFTVLGKRMLPRILWTMVQYGTIRSKRAFFANGAAKVWHIWHGTMSRLAHDYQMTVVAGSALIPESRWMYDTNSYMPRSAKIYNLSFTVGPDGHVLSRTKKVNLVPTQEDVLELTRGRLDEALDAVHIPGTSIPMATAICYDAFWRPHTDHEPTFQNVLAALDAQGVQLVAQPSANPWRWDEAWPFDPPGHPPRTRAQQWDQEGSQTALKHAQHVEVIINPQLLLEFLDLHFDGPSRILARNGETVSTLVEAGAVRGPEAEMVLKSEWDFSESNAFAAAKTGTEPTPRPLLRFRARSRVPKPESR
ncbi:nitrilase-related carbon-nitrogen hydrolase [Sulfobacillus harzensis]|uniref:nitrilase-related carbon-nitrogen hydrolase n=1 Tax=Sulfobacillus harzensis TaxID=2729629 RepID=UPI001A9BD06A|nr:nitrilase-related carbon-nitrogen hydrolase [Sulfobacillus harzensis]